MDFARVDNENRIIAWSETKLDGFDVEFSNGDYVDETCTDGLEDFIIEDGLAVFSPKPEKMERLAKEEQREAMLETLLEHFTEELVPSDKQGQLWKITMLGDVEISREYVDDPNASDDADGSYLNPITYVDGMTVNAGKFYTDGEDIWEAIKDGVPSGFDDESFFDIIVGSM